MTADEIARTIQLILAPVVMVSACAITLNGIMSHSQAVNDRLRLMTRERVDLLRGVQGDERFADARLIAIDHEAPDLLRRHHLVRDSLLAIDAAMAIFVACMLAIAVASVSGSSQVAQGVLALFLLGTLLLLVGVVLSAIEIRISHRALEYEVRQTLALRRDG